MSRLRLCCAALYLACAVLGPSRASDAAPPVPVHRAGSPLPAPAVIPDGPLGDAIRYGENVVTQTRVFANAYTRADLDCTSCHLAGGRTPGASPWVGIWGVFPVYSARAAKVETLEDRINDCFVRSMNGTALPEDGAEMLGVLAYMRWLSSGVPTGEDGPGRGFVAVTATRKPDPARGKTLYLERCAACHGVEGQGVIGPSGAPVFPPLWGPNSFNIAAGMARLDTAAAFIAAAMPAESPGTLAPDDAYDIASFFTTQPRPDFAGKSGDWPKGGKPADARY